MWSARERTIIARTKQYLEKSYCVKVELEELEDLLGPGDVDVDFRQILLKERDEKKCATFETFSTDGPSEFLMISRSRWDKYERKWNAPWRQNSSASASGWTVARGPGKAESWMELCGKKGYGGSGRLLGGLRQHESGHRGFGALDGARKPKDLCKVHPEVLDERRQQYFQLFDTSEKQDHFVANRKRWLESQGRKGSTARELATRVA